MTDVLDRIEFIASLSSAQRHPIKLGNDTGQMTIELPKSEASALLLVAMYYADKTFKVTIEPDDSERDKRKPQEQWSYPQAKGVA